MKTRTTTRSNFNNQRDILRLTRHDERSSSPPTDMRPSDRDGDSLGHRTMERHSSYP